MDERAARERALSYLRSVGAAETAHLSGDLLSHLEGTERLLSDWGNHRALCLAGLCHAVYGTDGLPQALVDPGERAVLREIIGEEAEEAVYFYAACDRSVLFASMGRSRAPRYRDRLTGRESSPADDRLRDFIELTFANELDLAMREPRFAAENAEFFLDLFRRCRPQASQQAYDTFRRVFGDPATDAESKSGRVVR